MFFVPHKEQIYYPPFSCELITEFLLMTKKYKVVSELLCSVSAKFSFSTRSQHLTQCLGASSWHQHAIVVPRRAVPPERRQREPRSPGLGGGVGGVGGVGVEGLSSRWGRPSTAFSSSPEPTGVLATANEARPRPRAPRSSLRPASVGTICKSSLIDTWKSDDVEEI